MTIEEMRQVINLVAFEGYTFTVFDEGGAIYLRASYIEADIITGAPEKQQTRKWLLSTHMVKGEIVQTAFKCVMTSMEHRAREHFLYRGERIFGPHFDIDGLWQLCRDRRLDYRGRRKGKIMSSSSDAED